ncbi:hypothetical protein Tco_0154538 [Tanacetum coccineum]
MTQKNVDSKPQAETVKVRPFWSQEEDMLLAECFIQIFEDPRIGSDQKNDTFWYKILDSYNDQAGKRGFPIRTKNMLTGKWTPMNPEVSKFNMLVNETQVMNGENDADLMTLEQSRIDKCKTKPSSAYQQRTEPFGDDELPRPAGLHRIAKSQRSSNSTASSGSNPQMFQEMIQQQYELDLKEKMERIDREVNSRVELNYSKKVTEDLKVLQISPDGMNPIDAAIINAQKDRIRALYGPNN